MKRFLHNIQLYANILLIILLLLSYASVYVSPEMLWPMAFFGLAFPFLLLFNAIAVVYWLVRWRKEFLLSLLAILIGWNYMARIIQIPIHLNRKHAPIALSMQDSLMKDATAFKVMSYNVRAFNRYKWDNDPNIAEELASYIQNEDPQILFMQEFFTRDKGGFTRKDLDRVLIKTPYHHIYYFTSKRKGLRRGIATYSAYPIINKGSILFENTSNVVIYTDIVIGKDTVRIYNDHLQSVMFIKRNYDFIDTVKLAYNDQQVAEVRDISIRLRDAFIKRASQVDIIADHILRCPYPVILCGDFNDTPVSYTYQRLRKNLNDAFIEEGKGMGSTYRGNFPSFRIDYILYGKPLSCMSFENKRILLSDHYPLVARFIIP